MRTVNFGHPALHELAQLGDEEAVSELQEHLRRCDRCRTVAADYVWLTRELTAVLRVAAEVAGAPCSRWQTVQKRLSAHRRRQAILVRLSLIACTFLAVGTMVLSSRPGDVIAQGVTMPPRAVVATRPVTCVSARMSVATPTPALGQLLLSTPAPLLPPTPPDVGI
jgi:ribosomal protein L18E